MATPLGSLFAPDPVNTFFKCAWGSVELWLSRISTDEGRKLVIQQYTRGNVPDVQNRGDVPKITHCTILFDNIQGQAESGQQRLLSLIDLKEQGKPQLFTHPIHGTYLAEIEDFTHEIDDSGTITGSASFVATEAVGAVVVDPIGISTQTDSTAVSTQADNVSTLLAAAGMTSTLPDLSNAFAASLDNAPDPRSILTGVSTISEQLWEEIDELQLSADVTLWPLLKAYVLLGDAIRASGQQAFGDTGGLMSITINGPMSLRRLVAEIYDPNEVDARISEVLSLNPNLRTPARIPAGTVLQLRQPD